MPPPARPARPVARPSVLSSNQVRLTILVTILAYLYRTITQRAPILFVSNPPALPTPNTCAVHHPILQNCEDLSHLPNTPYIFLSCDPARRQWSHFVGSYPPTAPVGEIFLWNYQSPETPPILISTASTLGPDFHPLGLSATSLSPTHARLFITNHARSRARVEVLDVHLPTGASTHVKTIANSKIHSPNGIAAYNSTAFYLTNDLFMARRWSTALIIEALLGIPGGQVLFVSLPTDSFTSPADRKDDEATVHSIAHVCFANGLAYDHAGKTLYVASTIHGVYTYAFPTTPWSAVLQSFRRTPFAPDNLLFSHARGRLYVSGVASVSALAGAMMEREAPGAPSWTVELLPEVDREEKREMAFRSVDEANVVLRVEERRWRSVFMDDGTTYGGVSTGGVVDEKGTYVGVSMVREGVVVCGEVLERRGSMPKGVEKDEL